MGHSEELSKSAGSGWSSETLFRRARREASSALSDGGESDARSATPRDLRSACALLCDTDDLYASLRDPEGEGRSADDQASFEVSARRRFEALRGLTERPATTMGAVLAKARLVSHCAKWVGSEDTELGRLAVELVHELPVIEVRQDNLNQIQLPQDCALARGCDAFIIADRTYEKVVSGGQLNPSEIDMARQRRADSLAAVMRFPAATMSAAAAKAEVVLHYARREFCDATDLGLLALVVLQELKSIAEFA